MLSSQPKEVLACRWRVREQTPRRPTETNQLGYRDVGEGMG